MAQFIPPGGLPGTTPVGLGDDTLGSLLDQAKAAIPKSLINEAGGIAGLNDDGYVTAMSLIRTVGSRAVSDMMRWRDLHVSVREFGATGSAAQTTGTITAGTSILTVASIEDFAVGDAVSVAGASAASICGYLVATIESIDGLNITLDAPADTTVTGAQVLHDETDALNACFAYLTNNGGGRAYFPSGTYNINKGASDTTVSADGFTILRCPDIGPWVQPVTVDLVGYNYAQIGYSEKPQVIPNNGVVLSTKLTATQYGSSIFYGQHIDQPFNDYSTHLNPITINVSNMIIRQTVGTVGPSLTALNFEYVGNSRINNVSFDIDVPIVNCPMPSIASINAIRTPVINNYGVVILDNVYIAGYYSGSTLCEHVQLNNVFMQYCVHAFTPLGGNYMCVFNNVLVQECLWVFSAAKSSNNINVTRVVGNLKIEASGSATGWWTPFKGLVQDAGGLMQGNLTYQINGFTGTYPLANAAYPTLLFKSITGFKEQLAPLTVTASPFAYTPANEGHLVITGGTVTAVTLLRQGTTISLPAGSQTIPVGKSDVVTVTYTDAPTMTFMP
ncbi:hypothetical protein predicted by Glimmer/Critica [Acetobacter senegalensis]|uniref:Pectate lyase superfamily protein domain-containing protein n=1 Tax=Acetobacter senegalensis TaxID=446692 RepID=A0A0U5ETX5_9PROT|nr:hypothetical protein [Acetobacter senegalensis]CEF41145.1 hypothetical protein predicted by Glimmer/Critica [Acetobacter senegalensis]